MPWKSEIIQRLDHVDDIVQKLNACNAVYFDKDGSLRGTNTDWIGIEGAIRATGYVDPSVAAEFEEPSVGLVIGAGGAARAAIYALVFRFHVRVIHILNRDEGEVAQLIDDCSWLMYSTVTHVKSVSQAEGLPAPSYIIGTVPDFEAVTPEEKAVRSILVSFLNRVGSQGLMLDMCYRPRMTRNLMLAQDHGWQIAEGTNVVGHQIEALWRLWIDEERLKRLDRDGMWKTLRDAADRGALL